MHRKNNSQNLQTRIPFTPLPSSPASNGSPSRRERFQGVFISHSPSPPKRRRVACPSSPFHSSSLEHDTGWKSGHVSLPLTPLASSQNGPVIENVSPLVKDASSQAEIAGPSPLRSPGPSCLLSTTNSKNIIESPFQISDVKVQITGHATTEISSKHSEEGEQESVSNTPQRGQAPPATSLSSSGEDSDPVPTTSDRVRRNAGVSILLNKELRSSELGTPSRAPQQEESTVRTRGLLITKEDYKLSPRMTRASTRNQKQSKPSDLDSENEPDRVPTQGRLDPKRVRRRPAFSINLGEPSDLSTPSRTDTRTPKLASATSSVARASEDSSDDVASRPRRRLGARLAQTSPMQRPDVSAEQAAADLQEDLEDLRENEIHNSRTRGRMISSSGKTKQKHLETLRRRHARDKLIDLPLGSEILPLSAGFSDDGLTRSSEYEASDEDPDSDTEAIRRSLYVDADEYEDDFIDNDIQEGPLGAPTGLEEIPIQFTRHANKELKEYFRDAVEWMVHNKLNPAFARHGELYQIAFRKLDDEVQAYAGSTFISSVWSPQFTKALKKRPDMVTKVLPWISGQEKCDACNRRKHPARSQVILSGKAYDRATLEELSDLDDVANDLNEAQTFYIGSTCAANAKTAHVLNHWRIHLNFFVLQRLEDKGHLSDQKVIERDRWSTKRREKYSIAVVDEMEETGEIHRLYQEFKDNQKAAMSALSEGTWAASG